MDIINVSSISKSAIHSLGWKTASSISQILIGLSIQIALSRLLTPAEFGVYVYAMIFIGFSAQLSEAGIVPAIIQKDDLEQKHLTIGLILSLIIGLLVWVSLWLIIPVVSHDENEQNIFRALSFIFLLNAPTFISDALVQRNFLFNRLFWINNIPYLLGPGIIAIFFASRGFGAWSLVIGALSQSIFRGIMLFILSPFKLTFRFSWGDFRPLIRFSSGMTLARIANFAAGNSSQLLIGNFFNSALLGLFQRAYQLITTPFTRIISIVTSVLFPLFSRMQNDSENLRKIYLAIVSLASSLAFPVAIFVSITSNEVVSILFGDNWLQAAPSLAILSINAAFISIFTLADALARAKGAVYSQFRNHLLYASMVGIGSYIGCQYSIEWAALGFTSASFMMYILNGYLGTRLLGLSFFDFFVSQKIGLIIAIVLFGTSFVTPTVIETFSLNNSFGIFATKSIFSLLVIGITIFIFPKKWFADLLWAYHLVRG